MLSNKKIGILGGGQLGKMLCEAASPLHLNIHVLDQHKDMSAANYCTEFIIGNFKNYDDVYEFGKNMDILTIEIEHVNLEALFDLQKEGVKIYPAPDALVHIVDKGLQKDFYAKNGLPTSEYILVDSKQELIDKINEGVLAFPFVQKARKEGYDGRGVVSVRSANDLDKLFDVPSVVEAMVDIEKELAVITALSPSGMTKTYDPVEMLFRDGANILDVLISPANLEENQIAELKKLAESIINKFGIVGVLAIEFFIDKKGNIYINEIAPRPHNSGHQTIENNIISQYEMHLRAILDWPLVDPIMIKPAVMMNILGEEGYQGDPIIYGKETFMAMEDVYFHWYGKRESKAFRKMGHITILDEKIERALEKSTSLKNIIKVRAKN